MLSSWVAGSSFGMCAPVWALHTGQGLWPLSFLLYIPYFIKRKNPALLPVLPPKTGHVSGITRRHIFIGAYIASGRAGGRSPAFSWRWTYVNLSVIVSPGCRVFKVLLSLSILYDQVPSALRVIVPTRPF